MNGGHVRKETEAWKWSVESMNEELSHYIELGLCVFCENTHQRQVESFYSFTSLAAWRVHH
ncbi:hypothetical protein Fmac_015910 [Flemingia macrophylla]|uniref:Uncharacterized protein n=1 Tax=Flemingia macrophylla TaxID=520843 RepID=A0ABD1MGJ5_9FABA